MSVIDTLPAWGRLKLISGTSIGDQDDKYLTESEHKIGRLPSRADIVLSHVFISGLHCVITLEENEGQPALFRIRDFSRNGVCVNEEFLGANVEKIIHENDIIHLSRPGKGYPPTIYRFEIFPHAFGPELASARRSTFLAKQNTMKNGSRKRRGGDPINSMAVSSVESGQFTECLPGTSPKRIRGSNSKNAPDHEWAVAKQVESLTAECERLRGALEEEVAKADTLKFREKERERQLIEKERCLEEARNERIRLIDTTADMKGKLLNAEQNHAHLKEAISEATEQNHMMLEEFHASKLKAYIMSQQGRARDQHTIHSNRPNLKQVAKQVQVACKSVEFAMRTLKKIQDEMNLSDSTSIQQDIDSSDSSKYLPSHFSEPSISTNYGNSTDTIQGEDEDSLTQNPEAEPTRKNAHSESNSSNKSSQDKQKSNSNQNAEAVTCLATESHSCQKSAETTSDDHISRLEASADAKESSSEPLESHSISLYTTCRCEHSEMIVNQAEEEVDFQRDVNEQISDIRWLKLDVEVGLLSPHADNDGHEILGNDTQLSNGVPEH